jgi:hypothetical protein
VSNTRDKSAARALGHEASSSYEIFWPRADWRSNTRSNKQESGASAVCSPAPIGPDALDNLALPRDHRP